MKAKPPVEVEPDEWLSTRNKKKITKPVRPLKRHHAAIKKIGSSSKLWKMTQNSPPPPQLLTFTKQSDLMSYFNKKQDRKVKENGKDTEEAVICESDQDDDPLTNQFGFLSQEEETMSSSESNRLSTTEELTKIPDLYGDDIVFLTQENSNVNTIHPRENSHYVDRKPISDSEIDLHSMSSRNISIPKFKVLGKVSIKEYSDENSDIDFLSQSPNSNSETDHKRLEGKTYGNSSKLANHIANSELSEDIEFISQREQQNPVVQFIKEPCLLTSDELTIDSQSHNHASKKDCQRHKGKKYVTDSLRNSNSFTSQYIGKAKPYLNSNTRNLLVLENSDIDFESQSSTEEIGVQVTTGVKGNNFKELNGNSSIQGRRPFEDLPETIKFTESETDSCEDVMTRHKM